MAEPWWRERRALGTYCSRCARFYIKGRPEWETCLTCLVGREWTAVQAEEYIAKLRRVFGDVSEDARPSAEWVGEPPDEQLEFESR